MSVNHEHTDCKHSQVKYCSHCDVCYCAGCGREWNGHKYWYYTPHWTYTTSQAAGDPVYTTTTDGQTPNNSPITHTHS